MESWKLKELKEFVRITHGESYSDKIHEPLQSFHLKSMMAFYHAEEYQLILKEILEVSADSNETKTDINATIMAIFNVISDEKKGNKVILAKFKAEAHLIAAAQALHSLFDIIASIIFFALKLDSYPKPPRENKINLHSINKCLKENSIYEETQKSIDDIISSPEYAYLTAYVNTTKHKSLIPSSISASVIVNKSGILLNEFTYKDYKGCLKRFGKKWSQDFILVEFQELRGGLFSIGNTLNKYLNN